MDAQEIAIVAVEVSNRRTALYDAIGNDNEAVYALEDARNQAIIDGLIVGKNAEEREAKAAQVLAEQIGAQRITKAKVEYAKMMHDRAVMNWERVKYTIRFMEAINNAV